jgi:hypothetical protein
MLRKQVTLLVKIHRPPMASVAKVVQDVGWCWVNFNHVSRVPACLAGWLEAPKFSVITRLWTRTIIMPPADGRGGDVTRNERGIFSVPAPIKKLFDYFPLLSYPPNEPPRRSPPVTLLPTLYIFTTDREARYGRPSFNPSCLKWQVSQVDGLNGEPF